MPLCTWGILWGYLCVEFDSIHIANLEGYIHDQRRWGKVINPAISNWYNYRTRTHNIESKKYTYLLRTSENRYAKFKILNYYCVRQETDCVNVMCRRDEAACLTIEYVLQPNGESYFPPPPSPTGNQAALHWNGSYFFFSHSSYSTIASNHKILWF